MPYNPAGLFSLVASYFANPGTTIRTEQHNPPLEDIASALSSVYVRDGRAPMTGPLNMNGFAINNVVAGSSPGSVATLAQSMPIGAVIDYALKTAPAGWALCIGQILLANTPYTTLRTLLINDGFPYGQDGSGNPKLPDAKGCVTAGYDVMGGAAANRLTGAFGATVGNETQTLNATQLPSNIPINVVDTIAVSNIGGGVWGGTSGGVGAGPGGNTTVSGAAQIIITKTGTVTAVVNPTGGGNSHPNVQPTLIMSKIIKVSYDG